MINLALKNAALLGGIFFCLLGISIYPFFIEFGVYDSQRLTQIIVLLAVSALFPAVIWPRSLVGIGFGLFFLVGIISWVCAEREVWAFIEWAKFLLLFCMGLTIFRQGEIFKIRLSFLLVVFSAVFLVKILPGIVVALAWGAGAEVLAIGFSSHRHFTEFLVAIYTFSAFYVALNNKQFLLSLIFLFVAWFVVFYSGARASLIALSVASIGYFIIDSSGNKKKLVIILVPFVIAFLLYTVSTISFGEPGKTIYRASTTGRLDLWVHAINVWLANPVLGAGPMHFSYYSPGMYAHPHSVILQLLSEWGGLAFTCLVLGVIGVVKKVELQDLASTPYRGAAFLALIGLCVSGLFGGILVVPAVEVILFIMLGLFMSPEKYGADSHRFMRPMQLALAVVFAVTVYSVWPERMHSQESERGAATDSPRFWQNGGLLINQTPTSSNNSATSTSHPH